MKEFRYLSKSILLVLITIIVGSCEKIHYMDEPGYLLPKTVDEDPLLPRITVNGTELHAESFGDINKPIIVFLHGGPGSDYRPMISQKGVENASRYPEERTITNGGISQLQDEFYCVFYDQRGGGLSPRYDKGVLSFGMFVEDLNAIIDYYLQKKEEETGISENQVYLFGWSFGGTLATGFINKYPSKVKDVVLYEPGPLSVDVWDYLKENTSSVFAGIGDEWLEEYLIAHDHFSADDHIRADYQYFINVSNADNSQPEFHANPNTPYWRSGALLIDDNLDFIESDDFDITSNLSAFQGNMLFIGSDKVIGELPDYPDTQRAYYPKSDIATVTGVGHTGPWEKPDEVSELIRNYFQQ
jgi:proline iminopeptidase